MSFCVDIPTDVDPKWKFKDVVFVVFATKGEAIQWIRDHIGYCDDDGTVCLITEGSAEPHQPEGESNE